MHAIGEVGDEGASLHGHARVLVPGGAGADPPSAAEDEDEAVIRMEMRFGEIVALVPLGDAAVEIAFLVRVAPEARARCSARCWQGHATCTGPASGRRAPSD